MRSDGLMTSVRRTPNLSFTITASPRAIGFPLMSTSSVSPASFWSSTTEPGPSWSSSRMASRVRPISTVTSSGMSSSSSKLRGVSPAAVSVDSAMASPPLDARGDAHRVAAALHARRGEEARPPLDAHQDRPLAPGAQREHLARAEPEHVTQPHAVRAELGRDLELDRREHGAQAVAEAGARRLALAAHARLEAMAERIERRVRQAEPEPRGGLPRDPDRQLEEHDQILRPRDGGEERVRLRVEPAELDRRERPEGLFQVVQHACAEALEHALLDRREIALRGRRRPPGRAAAEHLDERRDERRRRHQQAVPAERRHAEDPEADRLREARRHARELEELEAAHVEGGHLAEERSERGAQPAHEAVHHQLEAREPAAQVALLAGEIEPLHAARRRAAAAGDGTFADAAQERPRSPPGRERRRRRAPHVPRCAPAACSPRPSTAPPAWGATDVPPDEARPAVGYAAGRSRLCPTAGRGAGFVTAARGRPPRTIS